MKELIVSLAVCCFIFSGCGNNGAKDSGPKGETEIVMWLTGSEGQAITIKKLGEEFYRQTKIRVKCDALSWNDAHSKYLTSIAGSVAPDIGTMGLTWGSEFGSLGAMINLKKEYPHDIDDIKASVFKGLWDSIEHNGNVYGVPFDITEHVLYYRSDMIPVPPRDWDELISLLQSLNKEGKSMLIDWGSLSWIGYSPFLWQAGGDYFNANFTESTVDSPQAVKAMQFLSDLYTRYNVPKTKIPLEQSMRTGDFPVAISGNWGIDRLRLLVPEINGKWSIATLPKGPSGKKTAFIGGRVIGIFSQSKNKDAAWKFIKFLSKPEIQARLYQAALSKQDTYLPPNIKTWDILQMDPKFKDVLVSQAKDTEGPPPVPSWDTSSKFVDEAIQKVVLEHSDPQKELSTAKKELDRLLNK